MQRRDPTGVETGAIAALVRLDGARVVDVGCGDGRLTRFAAERAVRVYAFDPDRERVEKARASLGGEQLLRVRFGVHGVEALEVPRERFDVALCGWSLWCVPAEGVVDALRKLHDALGPEGTIVDTQPLSPRPPVVSGGERLGSLDMREWARTIRAVDKQVARAFDEGLFEVTDERRYVVTDVFDTGDEFVDEVSEWGGTRIAPRLATKIRAAAGPVSVDEDVRLRLLSKKP